MPKFTKEQAKNPLKALTELKQFLDKKVRDAGNSSDLSIKIELIREAIDEYHEKMGSLSTIYTEHGHHSEEDAVIKDMKQMLPIMKGMYERYTAQYKENVAKAEKRAAKEVVEANEKVAQEEQAKEIAAVMLDLVIKQYQEEANLEVAREAHTDEVLSFFVEVAEQVQKQNAKNQIILDRIDGILIRLGEKIDGIGTYSEEALIQAVSLHEALTNARNALAAELLFGENVPEAMEVFKETCAGAIESVMSSLEEDLGWGEYLNNMLKSLANVFIAGAQKLGSSATFFNTHSKSRQAVAEAGQELQSDEYTTLSI